ncbi:MAG: PLP-dependent aminotransferase family protein [Sphaerochaetaceae bacterium]|nr:PLP-dependent aminotransferase family protein [Sphaerochaetaceae bacterium]
MHVSLYEDIYKKIALDIRTGRLAPDSKLPSIRSFADEKGISRNTVINAYNLLLFEGYIYSKEKSGFYVSRMETNPYEIKEHIEAKQVKEDKEESEPILDLSANLIDSSMFPYSTLRQLYREALSKESIFLLEQAGSLMGEEDLRRSIASFVYTHRGINCSFEQVVIGNGTAYHLQKIARLFGSKPTFIMEEPTFQSTLQIIKDTDSEIIQIKQDREGIKVSDLKKATSKKKETQLLHISPSHQFPMGTTMSAPRRSSILSWAYSNNNRYVIEDDYDSDFRYIGHPIPSLQSMDTRDRVIYLGTFSRTLTPALRVSYMILPKQLVRLYKERFNYYHCPVSRIDQRVLSLFIDQGYFVRHINRMKRLYRSKRDYMLDLLREKLPSIRIQGEAAGLHFIIKANKSENELIRQANKLGLFLRGTGNGWIIIGYAHLKDEEMNQAIGILEQIMATK